MHGPKEKPPWADDKNHVEPPEEWPEPKEPELDSNIPVLREGDQVHVKDVFGSCLGVTLERVHYVRPATGYKSITFNFDNGVCITVEPVLIKGCFDFPTMKVTKGDWEMIEAEKPKIVTGKNAPQLLSDEPEIVDGRDHRIHPGFVGLTSDLEQIDGANQSDNFIGGVDLRQVDGANQD